MPKKARELKPIEIKRLVTPGRYAVGGVAGLHLQVTDSGARSWILRAKIGDKRRDMGLGGYPDVSLAQAREEAQKARQLIREGQDPVKVKNAARDALRNEQAKHLTFEDSAIRCHASKAPEFRNEKHKKQWIRTLEQHAFPIIGNLPVSEIDLTHILQVLEPIWHDRTETASRVRQRIEAVLTWATVSGFRSGDNPARWQGNLKEVLPTPSKIAKVKHHTALPYTEIGQFMSDLRKREGMAAQGLQLLILTAARSGEIRGMTWDEVDMDAKTWTVPADRIKAGKEHRVPLSDDAIKILKTVPQYQGSNYVFPSPKGGQLSDVTLSAVMRRMGVKAVPHGFRSTFRDWCAECTNYPSEVAKKALAHTLGDKVEEAYQRGDLLEKRRRLMQEWNKYCNTIQTDKKGEVVPLRASK